MSSDVVYVCENSSIADLLRALIAKEDGKTVKVIKLHGEKKE